LRGLLWDVFILFEKIQWFSKEKIPWEDTMSSYTRVHGRRVPFIDINHFSQIVSGHFESGRLSFALTLLQ
jgi:hypothetical protein